MTDYTESVIGGVVHLLLFGAGIHFLHVELYIMGVPMTLCGAVGILATYRFCYRDGRTDGMRTYHYWLDRAAYRIAELEAEKEEAEKLKHIDKHL